MSPHIDAPREKGPDDRLLALAARQHGVVTRKQAIYAGLTRGMLDRRLQHRRLMRVHPGVYLVAGAPRTFEQRAFAAVAWAGPEAYVSHRSAAYLWKIVSEAPAVVDVCCTRKLTRTPPGVQARFTTGLRARDRGLLNGIAISSPIRTVIDLVGTLPLNEAEEALQRAIVAGHVDAEKLRRAASCLAAPGKRGPAVIAKLLTPRDGASHVPSPLERMVADMLAEPGFPPFVREYPVSVDGHVFYVDFAYPYHLVGIEVDGRRWHSDARAFERDRVKRNALTGLGWQILHVTHEQVRTDRVRVRDQLRALLAGRGTQGESKS
ncbi:MAG: type IV toxin-antitoxin system AbiEi family antitoxin domain-containing protein [Actinomycetota bacterium]|nr:type IV toxin-antitoxin system AbiEi family antitoxin domain-containing protein [Actinomycetota bacterium]